MDMEVIQEFSENQSYLNALSSLSMSKELRLKVPSASAEQVLHNQKLETMSKVLAEPLGRLLFHVFLAHSHALDAFLLVEHIQECVAMPPSSFKTKTARKLIAKFLKPGAKQAVFVPVAMVRGLTSQIEDGKEGFDAQLQEIREFVNMQLSASAFRAFVLSPFYKRLVDFRVKEATPASREDFTFIRILGEGGFGKVIAVSKNDTAALYACKTMSKARVIAKRRERLVTNEKDILARVYHPNIVTLQYAFQDEHYLYLVLDLMSGGELAFHLSRLDRFDEDAVRFYAASILLALEYLHSRGIVYRDLKPENVMLDADGYVRITDLGLCAFVGDEPLHQHCGTRSFMAPEQCYGDEGYGKTVDWWAFGVTIYVLLTGKNPFSKRHRRRHLAERRERKNDAPEPAAARQVDAEGKQGDGNFGGNDSNDVVGNDDMLDRQYSASSKVLFSVATTSKLTAHPSSRNARSALAQKDGEGGRRDDVRGTERKGETLEMRAERYAKLRQSYVEVLEDFPWPETMSKEARALCESLICMDPQKRLGAHGALEVKEHPFFRGVDWPKMAQRHIPPPMVPERDYVNARFLEAAAGALQPVSSKNAAHKHFADFEYVRPNVLQEEIVNSIHDKAKLAGLRPSRAAAAGLGEKTAR